MAGGGDNLQDPFNLMGRGDPFETASLLVTAGHLRPQAALAAVSGEARDVMGLRPAVVRPGAVADFVAVEAFSEREAIAAAPGTRQTFKARSPGGAHHPERRRPRCAPGMSPSKPLDVLGARAGIGAGHRLWLTRRIVLARETR